MEMCECVKIKKVVSTPKNVKIVIDELKKEYNHLKGYLVGVSEIKELATGEISVEIPLIENKDGFKETVVDVFKSKEDAVNYVSRVKEDEGFTSVLNLGDAIYNEFSDGEVLIQMPVAKEKYKSK